MSEICLCQEPELKFYNHWIDIDMINNWIFARAECQKCGADDKVAIAVGKHWVWLNNLG